MGGSYFLFPPISFYFTNPHLCAYIERHLREAFRINKPSNTKDLRVKFEHTNTSYFKSKRGSKSSGRKIDRLYKKPEMRTLPDRSHVKTHFFKTSLAVIWNDEVSCEQEHS